ncbi:DUF1569 domain-containing protein [Streptomyces sp. NPDC004667]|uniref:DUF1569 domain-containing protein n=1 Tax=Streptomyces sp. NPDC004667 TaxID=3154285 RepID=UPI0033BFB772
MAEYEQQPGTAAERERAALLLRAGERQRHPASHPRSLWISPGPTVAASMSGCSSILRRGVMRHPLDAGIDAAPPIDPDLPAGAALAALTEAVAGFLEHRGAHPPHPAYGPCARGEYAALHAMHLVDHLPGLAGLPGLR